MQELTQSRLKELLKYDPETGVFVWLCGQNAGKVTGCLNSSGYLQIWVNRKCYTAHRLAWLYVYGVMPAANLDHINCLKTDNRICNLRKCTISENNFNVGIRRDNSSGFKGVHWCKRDAKWIARIRIDGKRNIIGNFSTAELAAEAYDAKSKELHGDFYRSTL